MIGATHRHTSVSLCVCVLTSVAHSETAFDRVYY